ncbi:MAG: hypothetical protein FWE95_06860 [Planctomycetaceae bacterium]|nr:hypothetical protein [Planctomycetaceae bacterium]
MIRSILTTTLAASLLILSAPAYSASPESYMMADPSCHSKTSTKCNNPHCQVCPVSKHRSVFGGYLPLRGPGVGLPAGLSFGSHGHDLFSKQGQSSRHDLSKRDASSDYVYSQRLGFAEPPCFPHHHFATVPVPVGKPPSSFAGGVFQPQQYQQTQPTFPQGPVNVHVTVYPMGQVDAQGNLLLQGFVDTQGKFHPQGFVDAQGHFYPQGFIDSLGNTHPRGFVDAQGNFHAQGYVDAHGNLFPHFYVDAKGNIQQRGNVQVYPLGSVDSQGRFYLLGFVDSRGVVHQQGVVDSEGDFHPQGSGRGFVDADGDFHPQGYIDAQGKMRPDFFVDTQGNLHSLGSENVQGYVYAHGYASQQGFVYAPSFGYLVGYRSPPIPDTRIVYVPYAAPPAIYVQRFGALPKIPSVRQLLGDATMYEYPEMPYQLYTTRGARDFLAPNPPGIGE